MSNFYWGYFSGVLCTPVRFWVVNPWSLGSVSFAVIQPHNGNWPGPEQPECSGLRELLSHNQV